MFCSNGKPAVSARECLAAGYADDTPLVKYIQGLESHWQQRGGIIFALMETLCIKCLFSFSFVFDADDASWSSRWMLLPLGTFSNRIWFYMCSYVCNTRGSCDLAAFNDVDQKASFG